MIPAEPLLAAIGKLPPGRWGVGVSGGADSVALLRLLRDRADVTCHVIHLNHQTRGEASDGDAGFVRDLANQLGMDATVSTRADVEHLVTRPPSNLSAHYRMLRLALFRQTVEREGLQGVALAHHADDQAETSLHRLLRGSACGGLGAMRSHTIIGGLHVHRPLLGVSREGLRDYLAMLEQPWREDASNQSAAYARNRLRKVLGQYPQLCPAILTLGRDCSAWNDWKQTNTATLREVFNVRDLIDQPVCLARASARRWLIQRGVPQKQISTRVIARLLTLAEDAASSPRAQFPGNVLVNRHRGYIEALASGNRCAIERRTGGDGR